AAARRREEAAAASTRHPEHAARHRVSQKSKHTNKVANTRWKGGRGRRRRAAPTPSFMPDHVAFFTTGRRERLPVRIKFWDGAGLKNRAAMGCVGVGVRGLGLRWEKKRRRGGPSQYQFSIPSRL